MRFLKIPFQVNVFFIFFAAAPSIQTMKNQNTAPNIRTQYTHQYCYKPDLLHQQ